MLRRLTIPILVLAATVAPVRGEGIRIEGRALVSGGAPLPQAEVRLFPLSGALGEARAVLDDEPAEPVARALTGAEGRFQIEAPHAGLWRLRVARRGFVAVETNLEPLIEPVVLSDAKLAADSGIRVKVTDEKGAPLEGVRVVVRPDRSRFGFLRADWSPVLRHGLTDSQGLATLSKAERERVAIGASAPGRLLGERAAVVGKATTIRLAPGVARVVEVKGADGQAGARVLVALGRKGHPYALTDAAGRATVAVEAREPIELSLLAPDGRRFDGRIEAGPPEQRERPIALELPDRAVLVGKLIDADSRRPIAGGIVWDAENPREGVVTDRAGGFVLGGPAGSRVRLTAGAPGYLGLPGGERQLQLGDGSAGPTLALRPGAAIEGTVLDEQGEPVVGAELTVERKQAPGMMRIEIGRRRQAPRNLSGARGQFRLSPVDPDERYSVKASAEGFAPAEETVGGLEPYGTKKGVRVTLTAGRTVVGRVVDGEARPIREASVKLAPARGGSSLGMMHFERGGGAESSFEATTDGEGRFRVAGVPEGRFDLEARRRGFARTKLAGVEVGGEAEAHDVGEVVLRPGERVQGFVTDAENQPVEGVEVRTREAGPNTLMVFGEPGSDAEPDAVTDATGYFAVEDLAPDEKLSLGLRRTGFVEASVKGIQLPRTEPLEVVMQPASTVSGRVLSDEGEPVPGARVELARRQTVEMGGNVMITMMMEDEQTDAEGRFTFADQRPGRIALTAVASGYQEGKLNDVEVPKGEDLEDVELRLPAGSILVGQVFGPDGRPLIGAQVSEIAEQQGPMRMMGGTPTDGEGRYRLEGLAPGPASVEATHEDWPRTVRDVELNEGVNDLDLHFEGGQTVSGRIVDGAGSPVPDAVARLAPVGRFFGGPQTTSGPDGTFEMPGVADGDYQLFVVAEGYASSTGERKISVAGQPLTGLEVQLDAGATVSGVVVGLEPEDYGRVFVKAEGPSSGGFEGAPVDRQGHYRLEHLEPGTYEIVAALSDSGRKATAPLTIEPGQREASADLRFEPGLTLSGSALQGQEPVVGATVFVEGLSLDHTGWGQTDNQGEFSIDGLDPGRYRVNLRDWTTGLAHDEEVELTASREIALKVPTARLTGRVIDATDRTPLTGVTLTLVSNDPADAGRTPLHAAATDLEGRFEIASVGDGSWRLNAEKEGYAAASRPVEVQFDKTIEDLELSMDATEGVTLEARLPTGQPPSELAIAVVDPAGIALVSGNYPTGENGRVRLASVPPGTWDIVIGAAGAATSTVEATAPGPTLPVALRPATTLSIEVPELAVPGTKAFVRLSDASGTPFRNLGWTGRPQSEWAMSGGRLQLGQLPPGRWTVRVAAADGREWSGSSVTSPGKQAVLTLE